VRLAARATNKHVKRNIQPRKLSMIEVQLPDCVTHTFALQPLRIQAVEQRPTVIAESEERVIVRTKLVRNVEI